VFISHSSRDFEPAARIKVWLGEQGFEAPFLDFDKHAGIPPGADWEKTLYREIERSEAVIIIQTPNWLESKWCFAEFTQARALGKAIFPVIETPTGDTLISPDIQTLDLRSDRAGGLQRLSRQLTQIALDAQGGFAWDSGRPPYPGLLAFQEEDAALYFGRDDDIRRLIERLNARRAQGGAKLIALLGASGSGKSSLLRAGVIPRLKRAGRNWIVLPPMRPRARPVDELAQCLAVACSGNADWRKLREDLNGQNVVLMLSDVARDLRIKAAANEAQILLPIDQGEELFGAADLDHAQRFFEILNATLSDDQPFIAVMALRSDYLGQLQSAERLKTRFEEFSLGPMPLARIPQIIEGPARVAGLRVDDAFVQQAVRDAETADALPLLAFALRELYDRASDDHYLNLAEYNALGDAEAKLTPLENSVRKAADEVLAEAKPGDEELNALRDAFVPAMVRVNDQAEYVRRPARWDDLPSKSHSLLERLAKARLLIVSQQGDKRMVEVAHEALLRKWPRLRAWLDEAREFLAGKQQLEVDLRDWERASEVDKPDALLAGMKLHRARGWLLAWPQRLSEKERAYIRVSIDQAETVERHKLRQRRIITWGSLATAAVLACVTVFAVLQWQAAIAQKKTAETAQNHSLVQALSGQAPRQHERTQDERAALLARQAYLFNLRSENPILYQANVDDALRTVLSFDYFRRILRDHTDRVWSIGFSPDRHTMASGSLDGTIRVWDLLQPEAKPIVLHGHENWVTSVAFSPDGQMLASSGDDKTVRLWDLRQASVKPTIFNHNDRVWSVAFSRDGHTIASGGQDKTVSLWDLRQPSAKPIILNGHTDLVRSLAFSSDGQMLASGSDDKTVILWNLRQTDAEPIILRGHEEAVTSVALSPDGQMLASGSRDNTVRLWNLLQPDTPPATLFSQSLSVRFVAFSPDGQMLASGGDDKTVRLWDLRRPSAKPIELTGPLDAVNSVAFSPDGQSLAAGSDDKTVGLFELGAPSAAPLILRQKEAVSSVVFSPDANTLASGSMSFFWKEHDVNLWTLHRSEAKPIVLSIPKSAGIYSVAFSPDGQMLATSAESQNKAEGGVQLWNLTQPGSKPTVISEARGYSVAFSPDGHMLAAAGYKQIQVWNLRQLETKPLVLEGHENYVTSVAFSPDGHSIASGSKDNTVRLWNLEQANTAPIILRGHEQPITSLAFAPNGHTIASGSEDKTVRLWDLHHPNADPIVLRGHEDKVRSVAFSVDGQTLASSSNDQTIRLWWEPHQSNAVPTILRAGLGSPTDGFSSVAFSSNGQSLASGSDDGSIRVWNVRTENLADLVCKKVWRNLTLDEWRRFVGEGVPYERTCPNLPADSESTNNSKPPAEPSRQIVTPEQTLPTDKSTFNHYPRTVTLRWSKVPGATSYSIETSRLSGSQWAANNQVPNLRSTSYTFDFVGKQKGRWRVWAVDDAGHESGKSGWWEFTFTR
jgi:WD40 repeat protein